MGFGSSLRSAARSIINSLGNTIAVYTYASATKSTDDEGEVSVSSWGTPASVKAASADKQEITTLLAEHGIERVGNNTFIMRDDTAIAQRDKITENSINYIVDDIQSVLADDTVIFRIVATHREL